MLYSLSKFAELSVWTIVQEKKGGGIFGFVTNNKSSEDAIYLDDAELTASGGGAYVGQMIKSIGDRGQEGGKLMEVRVSK